MKLKIYLIGSLALLSQVGCSDYLDEMPISAETNDNAYMEATQIEAALSGTYESFQSSDYYVWDNVLLQDVRSDNYYAGGDNAEEINPIDDLNIAPTNPRINKAWSNIYNAILKANTVLEKAPLVADPRLTEERRKQIIGEAKFLRAYHYYNLVTMWGGVPIVLVPTQSASPSETQYPRASVEAVYDQILRDLNDAIASLPDTYGDDASINKARATAGAAHALAAKAYMQMPAQNPTLALEHIAAVEASKAKYKLINYAELFDGNHYNNDESIIEVQFIGGKEGNWAPQMHLPPSISGDSWRKFVTPSHDLINAFDAEGDVVRKNATVMFEKVSWVDEFWFNASNSAIPFAYKWKNASGWASSDRQYILRYGDIVLLKAEALNETGDINGAAAEVNKIRLRAQLPVLTPEQMSSKAVLKNTILKERRLELAQEAQRWTDLVRFGVAVSTMQNLVEIDLRSGSPVVYPMTAAKILLPIPQTEIDRNPLVTQNPL